MREPGAIADRPAQLFRNLLIDSKQPWNSTSDHRLVFTGAQFDSWIASLHTEPAGTGCIEITRSDSGTNEFRSTVTQAHGHPVEFTEVVAPGGVGEHRREFALGHGAHPPDTGFVGRRARPFSGGRGR